MSSIFGEEHFFDKAMISIIEERGKAIDNFIYDEIAGVAKYELSMPKIIINKDKVKKWLILCSQLENIEHSELIDIATKKRITDLEAKLTESESELEKQKEKYDKLYGCYKKTSSEDLQDKYRLAEENEQLKQQLAEKEEVKLPNDLIKATDYSKAKDREIHEFEYRNGTYIHKYVLGGEHELTPQEIIDCLNALATIDCDLQTAYAYIQGQQQTNQDKIELLEKVESYIKDSTYIKEPDYTNVCEYIRTLIKEIKGE